MLKTVLVEWSEYGGHQAFEIEPGSESEMIEQRIGEVLDGLHADPTWTCFEDVGGPYPEHDDETIGWPAFCLSALSIDLPDDWTWFFWDFDDKKVVDVGTGKVSSLFRYKHGTVTRKK